MIGIMVSYRFCIVTFIINSAIVMAALIGLQHFIINRNIIKYVFYFIMFLYIGYIHMVFRESFSKKLFVMFSTWVISAMIFIISIVIAKQFFDYEFLLYFEYGIIFLLQGILLLFLARPWFRKNYRRTLLLGQDNIINLMSVYMIIAFLFLVNNTTVMDINLKNMSSSKNVLLQQSMAIAEKRSEINFKIANFDALTRAAARLNILNKITEAIIDHDTKLQKFAILVID